MTFFFERDPDDYLDFTILRNGAYKIVNGGVHLGTWPLRNLPDFFHNLFLEYGMKTQTLTKLLEPAFDAYRMQMMPGIAHGIRLSLRSIEGVITERDYKMSLSWRDRLNNVAAALMQNSGLDIVFAYVFGNEIHLLVSGDCNFLRRDVQRTVASLTSLAALTFSQGDDDQGIFDCRIAALPTWDFVQDYFSHQRTNCRDRAITILCENSMSLTFPELTASQVSQKTGGMNHGQRLAYAEAYGTLHGAGPHMDTWYEFGHMLQRMEPNLSAHVAISPCPADIEAFSIVLDSASQGELVG